MLRRLTITIDILSWTTFPIAGWAAHEPTIEMKRRLLRGSSIQLDRAILCVQNVFPTLENSARCRARLAHNRGELQSDAGRVPNDDYLIWSIFQFWKMRRKINLKLWRLGEVSFRIARVLPFTFQSHLSIFSSPPPTVSAVLMPILLLPLALHEKTV